MHYSAMDFYVELTQEGCPQHGCRENPVCGVCHGGAGSKVLSRPRVYNTTAQVDK